MARELVVYCDACAEIGEAEQGHLVTVSLDGAAATGFDLCEQHDKELFGPVRDLIASVGVPAAKLLSQPQPKSARPAAKPRHVEHRELGIYFECYGCPPGEVTYSQLQALSTHWANVHNFDSEGRQSVFMFGQTCPLCNEHVAEGDLGRFHSPHAHPDVRGGSAGLFLAAQNAGDKYKVIKKHREHVRKVFIASQKGVAA